MNRVLFVCTGNTCRSPMAAGIFNKLVRERNAGNARAESAGLAALRGLRATPQAIAVAHGEGVDIRRHRSQPVTEAMLSRYGLVLTMSGQQWYEVSDMVDRDYVKRLSEFGPNPGSDDVSDPIGGSQAVYQEVYDQLYSMIDERFDSIVEHLDSRNRSGDT
jgi:protein arginine phosphatase